MISEFLARLASWYPLDTWTVVTAALAAMACALPGNFLLLRRQSMMGDALSHTVLPGIVIAFLAAQWLLAAEVIAPSTYFAVRGTVMFLGALGIGVITALVTEWIRRLGRVEASAALGVVYTALFALGVLLVRLFADTVHIDADCVLYGEVQNAVLDRLPGTLVPRAAVFNAAMLLFNGLLVVLFYKELRLCSFDPSLATAQGVNARFVHYAVMAVTAATLVAAFKTAGSILVVAMLIVPAATARLLTDRMWLMLLLSLAVAAASAVLGHVAAMAAAPAVFHALGFESVGAASTTGMMALAAGFLFLVALLFSPKSGVVARMIDQFRLSVRIAAEDLLGLLYRLEEHRLESHSDEAPRLLEAAGATGWLPARMAVRALRRRGLTAAGPDGDRLTDVGREKARQLVRSHRLWETYLARHFDLPPDHLHGSAHRVEHYVGDALRAGLAEELDEPARDPHGREIPK
jgi:manganese/zinc/iron transport system permease protein